MMSALSQFFKKSSAIFLGVAITAGSAQAFLSAQQEKTPETKKYELVPDQTTTINGHTLHRIRALKDIKIYYGIFVDQYYTVKSGETGGFVESEENLSQKDSAWIWSEAKVFEQARVFGDAQISGNAQIYGRALVFNKAKVGDDARVYETAYVYDEATISGRAQVRHAAVVSGNVSIDDDAQITGRSRVHGRARISDHGEVENALVDDFAEVSEYGHVVGNAKVMGRVQVSGIATVGGNSLIFGDVKIRGNSIVVGSIIGGDQEIVDKRIFNVGLPEPKLAP